MFEKVRDQFRRTGTSSSQYNFEYARMKHILSINAAVIAGLLILLGLYPFEITIHPCDYWSSAESVFRTLYGLIAGMALVLFAISAVMCFLVLFDQRQGGAYLLLVKKRRGLSTYATTVILAYMGFVLVAALGASMTFAIYAGMNLDGNYFCPMRDTLQVSDAVNVS